MGYAIQARDGAPWRIAYEALVALAFLLFPLTDAAAHTRLVRSSPSADARLESVPAEVRLVFSGAVERTVTRLSLVGPDGVGVALGPVLHPGDSARVVVVPLPAFRYAGTYTVVWQTAAADGHPLRGQLVFTIAEGAAGLLPVEAPPLDPPADLPPPVPHAEAKVFDASSPLYVAVRWLGFGGLLGVIGAVAFRFAVLGGLSRSRFDAGVLVDDAMRGAARIGAGAAVLLLGAALLRLWAQGAAILGTGAPDPGAIGSLLLETTWGRGWLVQATAAPAALLAFLRARSGRRDGWSLALLAAVAAAFSPALMGHAIAHEHYPRLAVLADGAHVLGAGGWLGSLFVLLTAGLAATQRMPEETRADGVRALVHAFSPTALTFAAAVVASGAVSTALNVGSVAAFTSSAYGRTLLVKLALLSTVFAVGAWNWLQVRPRLGAPGTTARLRRSSSVELALAILVLAITAVLVATPPAVEAAVEAAFPPEAVSTR